MSIDREIERADEDELWFPFLREGSYVILFFRLHPENVRTYLLIMVYLKNFKIIFPFRNKREVFLREFAIRKVFL